MPSRSDLAIGQICQALKEQALDDNTVVIHTSDNSSLDAKSEGVRTERWKYIRYTQPQPPVEQLFDLTADPQEEKDLAHDPTHAKALSTLRDRCDAYRRSLQ